jgi:hypothetical protein
MNSYMDLDRSPKVKRSMFLLLASPLAFIAVIITAILGFSNVGVFEEITPEQMRSIGVAWSIFNTLVPLAILLAMGGIVVLSQALKDTTARLPAWIAMLLGLVVIAACVLFIIIRISLVNFQEPTLGLNQWYKVSDWAFINIVGPISMLATVSINFGLFTSGLLRRTGMVIAVLSCILMILAIVSQFPPFVFSFVWLVLGIALLLRLRHQQVAAKAPVS